MAMALRVRTAARWFAAAAAVAALCIGCSAQAKAATERVIYSFAGSKHGDGAPQVAGVVQDGKGNLYGTTYSDGKHKYGSVYKLSPEGKETTLYAFKSGADGANPNAGVTLDAQGNLYGTAYFGGGSCQCGTVFKVATDGSETTLKTFAGGEDGAFPASALLLDDQGNLYGTTTAGGGSSNCTNGCGTVFKLSPKGEETVLYAFNFADGADPLSRPVMDQHGYLYVTALGGNTACGLLGCGVVVELSPKGKDTVLHGFSAGKGGGAPLAGLLIGPAGTLYGVASTGGDANCNCGVAFSLTPKGKYSVLYSFKGGKDGATPLALPVLDDTGNLYGSTYEGGGSCNCGAVYELSAKNKESVLYGFAGGADGAIPESTLILDAAGDLYGTTDFGGTGKNGTVFEIER